MVMRPRSKVNHQDTYRTENRLFVWAAGIRKFFIKKVILSWVCSVTPAVPTLGVRWRIVEF